MATQVPPLRATAFYFECSLISQGDTDIFQNNPTLAAGDVVVYHDGALDGNIDTLQTAIGAGRVLAVTLSAAEMTADRVTVLFHDQAGDEWQDLLVTIHTVTTSQIDDLAVAATALSTAQWTNARAGYLDELDAPNLPADVAALPTAVENADALLIRDWTAVAAPAARSVMNALRFLRNRWRILAGILTVYEEDDASAAWTAAVDTAASDPVDEIDPT